MVALAVLHCDPYPSSHVNVQPENHTWGGELGNVKNGGQIGAGVQQLQQPRGLLPVRRHLQRRRAPLVVNQAGVHCTCNRESANNSL